MIAFAMMTFIAAGVFLGCIYRSFFSSKILKLNLYDKHNLVEALLDHSISFIWVKDRDLRYLFVNKHALEVFGFEEDEVIGKTDAELFPAPYALSSKDSDLFVIQEGLTLKEEHVARLATGDHDFYTIKTPLKTKRNKIYALCGIATDITKQKFAQKQLNAYLEKLEGITTELMQSRIQAEEVNKSQNAFLAAMSHELRTPLHGIIGNASLLLNSELASVQQKYLTRIQYSAEALMNIIDQILDFSKLAAGKIKLEPEKCNLEELAKGCMQILEVKAEEKKLEFTLENEPLPLVLADKVRLKEIFLNLLGNAIKFTDSGKISLKISKITELPSKVLLRFDVVDTGIGMNSDQLTRIFDRFWQAEPSVKGGTGLGLSITKELVSMMNGEISVESTPSEGTAVAIKIPFDLV